MLKNDSVEGSLSPAVQAPDDQAPEDQALPARGLVSLGTVDKKLLPGMAIISLWMLVEAGIGAIAVYRHVFTGPNRNGVLGIATILVGCGLGLIQRRRWGWALSLATCFFSLCFGAYALTRLHSPQFLVMTFLNAVFFLYLIRPEVRARIRS